MITPDNIFQLESTSPLYPQQAELQINVDMQYNGILNAFVLVNMAGNTIATKLYQINTPEINSLRNALLEAVSEYIKANLESINPETQFTIV